MQASSKYKHTYMYTWMGVPIIQFPQDILAMHELIWEVKPDLVIETGVARGGSVIFYASMLNMLGNGGKVVGIDIDIWKHNRQTIEEHPMSYNIHLIEGSSVSPGVIRSVEEYIALNKCGRVMVVLDSMHTHGHVLEELRLYSPFVKKDSYIVVFDTTIEDVPSEMFPGKPWNKENNPKTAVWAFLKENERFEINKAISDKLLISANIDGFLKCVR
jgi:cephalosporin hydroxylase